MGNRLNVPDDLEHLVEKRDQPDRRQGTPSSGDPTGLPHEATQEAVERRTEVRREEDRQQSDGQQS